LNYEDWSSKSGFGCGWFWHVSPPNFASLHYQSSLPIELDCID
jgi:hypothetical protein